MPISEFEKQARLYFKLISTVDTETRFDLKAQLNAWKLISSGIVANPNVFLRMIDFEAMEAHKEANYSNDLDERLLQKLHSLKELMVIQGPPGTGKTTHIKMFCKDILSNNPRARILISSQSNDAVDNVLVGLLSDNFKMVRVAGNYNKVDGALKDICLPNIIDNLKKVTKERPHLLQYITNVKSFKRDLILNNNISGVTLSEIGLCGLKVGDYFDYVIVDEVCKATLPELMVALCYAKKVVLIGDPCQLPPVFSSEIYDSKSDSEVEYLIDHPFINFIFDKIDYDSKDFLNKQYRMPNMVGNFVSKEFYNGELENGKDCDFPNAIVWLDYNGKKHPAIFESGSLKNEFEARTVLMILDEIRHDNDICKNTLLDNKKIDILIISPYKSQVDLIREKLRYFHENSFNIKIGTVDSFQGQSGDVVIFSATRNYHMTDFFKKPQRVNVAISRVKLRLYFICDSPFVLISDVDYLKELYKISSKKTVN
jgi:ATP-dependent RNA/DNA helicase IGHMBP2